MLKTLNHNIILPKYFGIVKKKGSSLLFSAQGGRGKEKNYKPAEKNFASPSEGAAEGGFKGGIPPRPSVPPSEARRYQFPPKKFRAKFRISHTLKKESVVRRPFFLCGDERANCFARVRAFGSESSGSMRIERLFRTSGARWKST